MTCEMTDGPVLLFDGVCNLCNGTVQFLLKRDRQRLLRFASLQSEAGQVLLSRFNTPGRLPDSVVLLEEGQLYTESTAALRIARILGGFWCWLYYLLVWIPRPLRDLAYRWVARNRYRWFGKREQCLLPAPEYRERFLQG